MTWSGSVKELLLEYHGKDSSVQWHGPVVAMEHNHPFDVRYYQFIIDDVPGLFWMIEDLKSLMQSSPVERGSAATRAELLLWNRQVPPNDIAKYLMDDATSPKIKHSLLPYQSLSGLPSGLHCFPRAVLGTGCRSLWWHPDLAAFQPPYYADFLGLDTKPFQEHVDRLQSEEERLIALQRINGPYPFRDLADWPHRPQLRRYACTLLAGFDISAPHCDVMSADQEAAADTAATAPVPPRGTLPSRRTITGHRVIKIGVLCRMEKRRLKNEQDLLASLANLTMTVIPERGDESRDSAPVKITTDVTWLRTLRGRRIPAAATNGTAAAPAYSDLVLLWGNTDSLKAQAAAVASFDLLIGVHGAGLANLIYMAPGSAVLEMTGNGHVNFAFGVLSALYELKYYVWRANVTALPKQCQAPFTSACKNHDISVQVPGVLDVVRLAIRGLVNGS